MRLSSPSAVLSDNNKVIRGSAQHQPINENQATGLSKHQKTVAVKRLLADGQGFENCLPE
ncbi:Uncharacterised protein [Hafnia alvei]|uniref:Uncharacterized protein n=1 Tax=Hafnia alvei TaxID=569 RepID=A0A377PNC9_HAFAL|nr:Uncharacterised protein [Hafnia alvei]